MEGLYRGVKQTTETEHDPVAISMAAHAAYDKARMGQETMEIYRELMKGNVP